MEHRKSSATECLELVLLCNTFLFRSSMRQHHFLFIATIIVTNIHFGNANDILFALLVAASTESTRTLPWQFPWNSSTDGLCSKPLIHKDDSFMNTWS